MDTLIDSAATLIPFLAAIVAVLAFLLLANRVLRKHWDKQPEAQFQFQLIMLSLTVAGVLLVVAVMPVSDALRGQFLSLIGILLSAAIALASTTFIGNILAGVMLKTIEKARPGDFITVEDLTGRITEMGLLHTEIQTEFRDLVTVPNSYMVARPLKVVRASGSIITAELSLGYDVPQGQVVEVLRSAAEASGLKDCFVHLRELGDFSVTYRVAGLLEDISSLISARSSLLSAMLAALHREGIEVLSPNYMVTRPLAPDVRVVPEPSLPRGDGAVESRVEEVAFDKADDAASAEKLRKLIAGTEEEIKALREVDGDQKSVVRALKQRLAHLQSQLERADERVRSDGEESPPP